MFRELDNCVTGGAEQYDVLWLHNEKEIKPSKDFEYKSSGQTHSLIIQEIFPEDAGSYTCEAFNDVGECFSTCSLVVEVPGEEVWLLLSINRCHSFNFFPCISFYLTDVHIVILGLANIALASSMEITSIDLNITPQTQLQVSHPGPRPNLHCFPELVDGGPRRSSVV